MKSWDYGSSAVYFITICTKDRFPFFGEIVPSANPYLKSTKIGKRALQCWLKIPDHFPFAEPNTFIIMPDHRHGILALNKPDYNKWEVNKFGPQSQNLASIIRGFKAGVKTFATRNDISFAWQQLYYEKRIKTALEFESVRKYILNNPARWIPKKSKWQRM